MKIQMRIPAKIILNLTHQRVIDNFKRVKDVYPTRNNKQLSKLNNN